MFQKKSMLSLLLITIFLFSCGAAINVSASETEITDNGRYEYSNITGPIIIKSDSPTVVLNNVAITAQDSAAITVEAGAELTLIINGENTLSGGNGEDQNGGDGVDFGTICITKDFTGAIHAAGGSIGADENNPDYGNSNIFGGGAGIGSGYPTANNARSVAFDISVTNGASITAYSGYHAQAIGYGYRPTDYTGYGIKLLLDGSITLWAENADFYQPALALATQYDSAPISYSDDSVYLVRYTDENRDASEATISKALGCLDIASANSISIDFKEILTAAPRGNWATLYRPAPTTGDLTVSKTVSGSGASDAQEFTFTVTLNDDSVNGVYGEMAFENGVSVFKLKAGESKTASDLPAEIAYTVTESDNDGYTVTVNGTDKTEASGTIIAGQTAKAAFNNEKSGEILPTADSSRSLLWGTALLLSCIGIYVAILCKRKQRGRF